MISEGIYLDEVSPDLSQGDIVCFCPIGAVADLRVARLWNKRDPGKDQQASIYSYPLTEKPRNPPSPPLFKKSDNAPEHVLVPLALGKSIVISDDCVTLAKAANQALEFQLTDRQRNVPWYVAPIRAWPSAGEKIADGRSVADLILQGRINRYLGLPPIIRSGVEVHPRSYVDLRFMTPLKPGLLSNVERLASMTDRGKLMLAAKLFSFFSGRTMTFKCRACGAVNSEEDLLSREAATKVAAPSATPSSESLS